MKEIDGTPGSAKTEKTAAVFNPPAVGLNDSLEFLGRQLHVQTEYIELPTARIATEVFCSGRIMLSKKSDCPSAIHENGDTRRLQQAMNAQHREILREIKDKQARILSSQRPPVQP